MRKKTLCPHRHGVDSCQGFYRNNKAGRGRKKGQFHSRDRLPSTPESERSIIYRRRVVNCLKGAATPSGAQVIFQHVSEIVHVQAK